MAILLTDLLNKIPIEVEIRVKRVRDQARSVLQESLRSECRLVLRTAEETEDNRPGAHVPVEVSPGHPEILNSVKFDDSLEHIMLVGRYRKALEQAYAGSKALVRLRNELLILPDSEKWVENLVEANLQSTANWAESMLKRLDKHDPLKSVLALNQDVLGVYEYKTKKPFLDEFSLSRSIIRIYWGVIGLVAEWMGCSVEDLTLVVLTHELAHAYTHLGADIEGHRWSTSAFAAAEKSVVEGLAQYYTHRVLQRLERRYPGASEVYKVMLPHQSDIYRAHKIWIDEYTPESVRRAMLEIRRWREGELAVFTSRLNQAQSDLAPDLQ